VDCATKMSGTVNWCMVQQCCKEIFVRITVPCSCELVVEVVLGCFGASARCISLKNI
jgi:hypothetical protein